MAHPPITNKPIPQSLKGWQNELDGWRRYIEKVDTMYRDNGPKWVRAQKAYARRRIDDLLDNAPRTMVRRGLARQSRV